MFMLSVEKKLLFDKLRFFTLDEDNPVGRFANRPYYGRRQRDRNV